MKLFKKAAALFFCLTLALSVMAVTALADDDDAAELMAGLAEPVPNAMFKVTLVKASANTDTTLVAANTDNILDRDTTNGYEVKKDNDVTFDIMLAYSGSTFTPANKIDGFQFTFVPGTASASDTNNKGVTISGFTLGNHDAYAVRHASGNYENVYASGSLGGGNDIDVPSSTATKIGTITFSFDNALQQNTPLTPTIKTMLIQIRNNQHPQWIVKAPEDNSVEYPYGATAYVTEGNPSTGYNYPTPAQGAASNSSAYVDGTATTDKPIYVNPYYTATLQKFHANPTTGVAELVTDSNKIRTNEDNDNPTYEAVTSTVQYYFDYSNRPSGDATSNVLTDEANIPGYTFKGWMVTTNSEQSANLSTWDEYAATDGTWNKQTSYPKVTNAPATVAATTAWYTAHNNQSNAATWDGKNDAATPVEYVTIIARDTNIENHPTGYVTATEKVAGVKFIPAGTANIPTGYVGNITLTPVYTRNVYTVTFNADDFNKNTGSKAFFSSNSVTTQTEESKLRTDYYTIEDLANGNSIEDYLKIAYETTAPFITEGFNRGLKKPGYKFVGWVPSGDGFTSSNKGYKWTVSETTTRVNQIDVVREAQMKRYGDLKLTAEWELDIYFAKVNYWFGGSDNSLILVAVPSGENGSYKAAYTYNCTSKDDNDNDAVNAMLIIPAGDQRNAYMESAIAAVGTLTENGANTITSALFNKETGEYKDNYVLFAYIADSDATDESKITLAETATTGNDIIIAYDGDVDGSGFVSVADFGNVDTLLGSASSSGANSTAHIFAITTRVGVEARLKADYTTSTAIGDDSSRAFASIADVKGIYNVMGYTAD